MTAPAFSGHLRLRASKRDDGRTTLAQQSFRAPFHLSKPYWDPDAGTLVVQVVNPTAGILSGDQLETEVKVDSEATLLVTTPSASRVFTMTNGTATCTQRYAVAAKAWLEVSPEPLVPHRGCRYDQSTDIDIAKGGGLFFVDQLMPGRIGHGEVWEWTHLALTLSVRLDGECILHERFAHSGPELRALAEFSGSGATACFANAVLVGPSPAADLSCLPAGRAGTPVPAWLPALRALHGKGVWLAVSNLRLVGWSIKMVATDPIRLRETLRETRRILAAAFPALACEVRKL